MATSTATKQSGVGFVFRVAAAVLGIAGLVIMIVCNSKGEAYVFNTFGTLAAGAVAGIALSVVALLATGKSWDKGYVGLGCTLVGIVAYTLTGVNAMSERILMISGLFSWNSMNTAGWETFYLTIGVTVCFVLAALALVVSAFTGDKSDKK